MILLYKTVLVLSHVSKSDKSKLSALTRLTPGDFALLQRRKRFTPMNTLREQAIAFLHAENARKQTSTPIGFIAN